MRISSGQRVRQLWRPPSTLPSWTHEDTSVHAQGRDQPPEERCARHITAAVMRLHSRQVCLITRRQTCLFQRPSSHTPTPVGSLVKGDVKGRGDDDDKGGRQQTRHIMKQVMTEIIIFQLHNLEVNLKTA